MRFLIIKVQVLYVKSIEQPVLIFQAVLHNSTEAINALLNHGASISQRRVKDTCEGYGNATTKQTLSERILKEVSNLDIY